jgi:Uma2 family endonuclease
MLTGMLLNYMLTFPVMLIILQKKNTSNIMTIQTNPLTYDDYRTLPNDGKQYEIIGGGLLMSPLPTYSHQVISRNLFKLLDQYISENKLGEIIYAPFDVVQPDLMYISRERADIIAENNVVEAPELVVEILSPATRTTDRTSKKALYQHGVREYWMVDSTEKTIDQLILKEDTFELNGKLNSSQILTSPTLKGFRIAVGPVFPNR